VPDWSITNSIALPLAKDAKGRRRKFIAAGGSRASPRFTDLGWTLVLSGYIFDEIAEVGDTLPDMTEMCWQIPDIKDDGQSDTAEEKRSMDDFREAGKSFKHAAQCLSDLTSNLFALIPYLSTFIDWEKLAAIREASPSPKGMPHEEIYWRTLCTDQMPEGYAETLRQYREWHKSLSPIRSLLRWRVNSVSSIFKPIGFIAYLRSTWQKYSDFGLLLTHLTHRRLGRTKKGYLCLVPASAQVGDEIALFRGGHVPLVIRDQGEEHHALVGEAFVLEIMQGEAFDESACQEIKIR
jgi:hypothetical protein